MGKAEPENDSSNSMAYRAFGTIVCSPMDYYPLNDLGLGRMPTLVEGNYSTEEGI